MASRQRETTLSAVLTAMEDDLSLSMRQALSRHNCGTGEFYRWLRASPERWDRYVNLKRFQAQFNADELAEIADDREIPAEHKRWMIDVRKFAAVKLLPDRYGDRVTHDGDVTVKLYGFDPEQV